MLLFALIVIPDFWLFSICYHYLLLRFAPIFLQFIFHLYNIMNRFVQIIGIFWAAAFLNYIWNLSTHLHWNVCILVSLWTTEYLIKKIKHCSIRPVLLDSVSSVRPLTTVFIAGKKRILLTNFRYKLCI